MTGIESLFGVSGLSTGSALVCQNPTRSINFLWIRAMQHHRRVLGIGFYPDPDVLANRTLD